MEKWVVVLVFASGAILLSGASILLRVLFRDKRIEDAHQRQREAMDAEMWANIDAAVKAHAKEDGDGRETGGT